MANKTMSHFPDISHPAKLRAGDRAARRRRSPRSMPYADDGAAITSSSFGGRTALCAVVRDAEVERGRRIRAADFQIGQPALRVGGRRERQVRRRRAEIAAGRQHGCHPGDAGQIDPAAVVAGGVLGHRDHAAQDVAEIERVRKAGLVVRQAAGGEPGRVELQPLVRVDAVVRVDRAEIDLDPAGRPDRQVLDGHRIAVPNGLLGHRHAVGGRIDGPDRGQVRRRQRDRVRRIRQRTDRCPQRGPRSLCGRMSGGIGPRRVASGKAQAGDRGKNHGDTTRYQRILQRRCPERAEASSRRLCYGVVTAAQQENLPINVQSPSPNRTR